MARKDEQGRFNPREVCKLVVNGVEFYDWLTVEVKIEIAAYAEFTFTCTEFSPTPSAWVALQFKPGDVCDVYFGDVHVLHGYILTRQVAFDGRSHAVQLQGASQSFDIASSSITTQAGNYDGYNWQQIAEALIGPHSVPLSVTGVISKLPFRSLQIQPGEIIWSCLERLASQRKIRLGSTPLGDVLAIGDNEVLSNDALVEGENILRARCLISDEAVFKKYIAIGQDGGTDDRNGDEANKQRAEVGGTATRYKTRLVSSETPDSDAGLQLRANMEHNHLEGAKVQAEVVVQGWFSPNGNIWDVRKYPFVRSPMMMIDQALGIRAVTFRQSSDGGTTTTLDLISPIWMNGGSHYSQGAPGAG